MRRKALEIVEVSKQYRLGEFGTGTLSHDLKRWSSKVRGKGDPYAMVGEENRRDLKGGDYVLALRDISFSVEEGEVLGIIGKNGAGKSTLLKLRSRVTRPSKGKIRARGRIASLLEVGTGMHPELTGRENVYLNGAILGMSQSEIRAKFDDIVEFSGCTRYVDTPVKRYSSGMKVRLGFAVAAFLEPEILIVDEVLAVGDAEFQRRAIGKMKDVTGSGDRTVLFVSHNMAAVNSLCSRALLLKNGMLHYDGSPESTINRYLEESSSEKDMSKLRDRKGNGVVKVIAVDVQGEQPGQSPQSGQPFALKFKIDNSAMLASKDLRFDLRIDDYLGQRVAWLSTSLLDARADGAPGEITFAVERLNLTAGLYYVTLYLEAKGEVSDWIQNAFSFEVNEGDYYGTGRLAPMNQTNVLMDFKVAYHV